MKKLLVLLLCAIVLCGCADNSKYEKTVFSMDTQITMTAYGANAETALLKAEEEIKRINEKYGIENLDKTVLEPDEETAVILQTAEKINKETDGAFDVRIAPVMRAWGFYSQEFDEKHYRVPSEDEIADAMSAARQGEHLDLGGIAKGYCADRVVDILKSEGVTSAVISLGGNVAVIGKNTDGDLWNVGVKNPFGEGIYATISVSDKSVVTSGDYVRYFEEEGRRYHHIIDPTTGYPVQNELTSVTIVADSGIYADGLSTALFVMGKDKAIDFWREKGGFDMILITKDGKIYYTQGIDIKTENEAQIINGQ